MGYLPFGYVPKVRPSPYAVSFWTQVRKVFGRKLKLMLVDSQLMGLTVLMQVSLCSMNIMPQLIDERNVMKLEVSEALYSEWAHIISTTLLATAQNMVGNTLFIVLMFALGGMDWSAF